MVGVRTEQALRPKRLFYWIPTGFDAGKCFIRECLVKRMPGKSHFPGTRPRRPRHFYRDPNESLIETIELFARGCRRPGELLGFFQKDHQFERKVAARLGLQPPLILHWGAQMWNQVFESLDDTFEITDVFFEQTKKFCLGNRGHGNTSIFLVTVREAIAVPALAILCE